MSHTFYAHHLWSSLSDFDMMHHASASILNPPVLAELTLYRACFPLGDPAGAPYRNPNIPLTCMNL